MDSTTNNFLWILHFTTYIEMYSEPMIPNVVKNN